MPAQGQDFARMALQTPPAAYDQTYVRTLVSSIERLLRSRLGRDEQPSYWGEAYIRASGTATAQAMTIGVDTLLQWDTLGISRDTLFEFVPGSNAMKALSDCEAFFHFRLKNTATTGTAIIKVFKNGTWYVGSCQIPRAEADLVCSIPIVAATDDLFTVKVNSIVAMNVDLTLSTWMTQRISADARMRVI